MKLLGISGSNREGGNSYSLLSTALERAPDVDARVLQVASLSIKPCELCFGKCAQSPYACVIRDDLETVLDEMRSADGVVIACPFYFYVPSRFQALLERISCLDYFTLKNHGEGHSPVVGKPCGLVSVSASGSTFNVSQILHHLQEFALMLGMRVVTRPLWPYIGVPASSGGMDAGAVLQEKGSVAQVSELVDALVTEVRSGGRA